MAPKLAQPAPDFKGVAVVDGEFKTIQLADYKGKYVVLFFYPLDFTFVCPTEIIAFSQAAQSFKDINCEVIACSTDSQFTHLAWINTPRKEGGLGGLKIPLLADKNMAISRAYDVLKEDDGIPFRGLYIIDKEGILRQMTVNDLPVGRSVDEVLRLVKAFQYTDEHGEGKDLNDNCCDEAQQRQLSNKRPLSPESVQHFAPDAKNPRCALLTGSPELTR